MRKCCALWPAALVIVLSSAIFNLPSALAQVPGMVNYQGRVVVNGTNFAGAGQFKFALVDGTGNTTYWSNGVNAVTCTVTKGLYSVLLGDTNAANMETAVPTAAFTHADVRLRVWFNDGVNGLQRLLPDQRIVSAGYAMNAAFAAQAERTGGSVSGFVSDGTNDVSSAQVYEPGLSVFACVGPTTTSGCPYRLLSLPPGAHTIVARFPSGRILTNQVVLSACDVLSNVDFRVLYTYYRDADGDGYGDPLVATNAAFPPDPSWVSISGDFNDACAACYPGAPEICDGLDNNGNGDVDENPESLCGAGHVCVSGACLTTYYRDLDRDGYGNPSVTTNSASSPGADWVTVSGDCDDFDARIHPGAPEVCDGIDNDCIGMTDDGDICAPGSVCISGVCHPL